MYDKPNTEVCNLENKIPDVSLVQMNQHNTNKKISRKHIEMLIKRYLALVVN